MNEELLIIKKVYGEKMMHLCKKLFPTILEEKWTLYNLLVSSIAPSRTIASDIIDRGLESDFSNFIYSFINPTVFKVKTDKTPFELMRSVGYTLFECKSNQDIQKFRKFYAPGEELCTFNGDRLLTCDVFFAIKDGAEKLNRKHFINPKRQDSYGTSVISIQFSRVGLNTVSIKNRYNHTVENPDATFSNNLDSIVKGLSYSFEKYYGLNIYNNSDAYSKFLIEDLNCIKASDGRYYKSNVEEDNVFYCENNIIIDNGKIIKKYNNNKERYIVMDSYILDLKEKKIFKENNKIVDSFINSIIIDNKSIIDIKNSNSLKNIIIKNVNLDDIIITIDKSNKIISYINNNVESVGPRFLYNNKTISYIEMNKLKEIDNDFLCWNLALKDLNLPSVETIKDTFLFFNKSLETIYIPNIRSIGNHFCCENTSIKNIWAPNLETIGNDFLDWNNATKRIYFPKLSKIGDNFMAFSSSVEELSIPNVSEIGIFFLRLNKKVKNIYFPNLTLLSRHFMCSNEELDNLYMPRLEEIVCGFLKNNKKISNINIESLKNIKNDIYLLDNNKDARNYIFSVLENNKEKILKKVQ